MTFEGKLEAKFAHADLYEKDRLKSLNRLLKDNLDQFDRAQEARTLLLLQAINAPVPAKNPSRPVPLSYAPTRN
jgi:hypothetical protein